MLLCGLWHGAAWTFVLWGVIHGLCLMAHRITLGGGKPDFSWPRTTSGWATNIVKVFLTFHFVAFAWVLFRASSLESALVYFQALFRFQPLTGFSIPVLFAGGLLIALDVAQTWIGNQTWITDIKKYKIVRYTVAQIMLLSILAATIAHLDTITPFIYFQF
jgi:alginate O-acetyltransferase complex protein AlgI